MNYLVTGGAGFIGSHLIDALLKDGHSVTNLDNFDPFYSRTIKEANQKGHLADPNYSFVECDITEKGSLDKIFRSAKFDMIIHLAAKAGVRPSIEDPIRYEQVNAIGTLKLLEKARELKISKFIFASSSSVYGKNPNVPWKESDQELMPISPYAVSKISAENYGMIYADLFKINFIALRFFTVFGPRQRPDLAIAKFFHLIYSGKPIPFFGDGTTSRDYTFIDDIIGGIKGAISKKVSSGKFEKYNLGNSRPVSLFELVNAIEQVVGKKAILEKLPMQTGDVERTFASIEKAKNDLSYRPNTSLMQGLEKYNEWYKMNKK